jgi:hypothetical protein
MLNSNKEVDLSKLIDEQFRPIVSEDVQYLDEMVAAEMRAKGLDPLNKDDVRAFWSSKGVDLNG